jgi:hypothetical protein
MALNVPRQIQIKSCSNVSRSRAFCFEGNETGDCVNSILFRVAPKNVGATIKRKFLRWPEAKIGMNVYYVLRAQQACIVECVFRRNSDSDPILVGR